jgi:MFS family permease
MWRRLPIPPAAFPPLSLDRTAIWLIAIAETIVWAAMYYGFPALFIRWEAAFGWSKPEITIAVTGALVASALASPVFGRLIDAGRGPQVMTGSALLGGLMLVVLAAVETLPQFYIVWALIGVAMGGCLYEPCFAFLTRARGSEAKGAITLVTLVAGFAGTLSFPLGHAVADAFGWRAAVSTYGALVLFVAVPLFFISARHFERTRVARSIAGENRSKGTRNFLGEPKFWLLALGFTFIVINHGVILNHLLPLLAERGLATETAVLAAAMIGPMQVMGRIMMMLAQRHVATATIMLTCFAGICAATLFLIGAAGQPALIAGFVILQGASFGVLSIVKPAITRDVMGEVNFGTISGAMAVPYLLGVAFAPFIGALIWLQGGYDLVLPVILLSALLGALLAWLATRMGRD